MDTVAMYVAIVGSFLMGFVIMWICFFILNRIKEFSATAFGEIITALFGGTVLTIYTTTLSDAGWIFWIYPVGLVVGMIFYHFLGGGAITFRAFMREEFTDARVRELLLGHQILSEKLDTIENILVSERI